MNADQADRPRDDHVSREVPPPSDEAGGAETHEGDANVDPAGPTMDIDTVETSEQDLQELFRVMTRDAVAQVKEHNDDILSVICALGGNTGKYQRERRSAIKAVVSEIYSPPRVTAAAKL